MSRDSIEQVRLNQGASLVDVVDRLLDTGVVLDGDAMLTLADVDLVYVGIKLVIASADRIQGTSASASSAPSTPAPQPPAPPVHLNAGAAAAPQVRLQQPATDAVANAAKTQSDATQATETTNDLIASSARPLSAARAEQPERGLAQLVLALVELLRQVMERQAIHRLERGTLADAEAERLGTQLMLLTQRMDDLKRYFDLTDDDLNLDLGPLGHLLD